MPLYLDWKMFPLMLWEPQWNRESLSPCKFCTVTLEFFKRQCVSVNYDLTYPPTYLCIYLPEEKNSPLFYQTLVFFTFYPCPCTHCQPYIIFLCLFSFRMELHKQGYSDNQYFPSKRSILPSLSKMSPWQWALIQNSAHSVPTSVFKKISNSLNGRISV